jgi:hypothetical protein
MACNTTNHPNGMYGEDITMNKDHPLRDSSALVSTDDAAATSQSGLQAARAVFDTVSLMLSATYPVRVATDSLYKPELLEQILKHLSIKSLASPLRVSKYCRQAILGSTQLRRTVSLEPVPATEWVIWQSCWYRCSLWRIVQDPVEESSVIIKAHPFLHFINCPVQRVACYGTSDREVEAAPSDALLFQPQPQSVTISYRGHRMSITRAQGLTFGALVAELNALRERCRKKLNRIVKRPCTRANRREYARTIEVLDGSRYTVPYIYLDAEDAEDEYSEPVCVAREARCSRTSWGETCLGLECHQDYSRSS